MEHEEMDTVEIDSILEILHSSNYHLDRLIKTYFLPISKLDSPILGNYSFKDLKRDFEYSLREYSITHSKVINPLENPSFKSLLKMNDISIRTYLSFKRDVDDILRSYTNEAWSLEAKRRVLENQLKDFTGYQPNEYEITKYNMFQKLYSDNKNCYLDSVLSAMQQAEVNQVDGDKYFVISSLLKLHNDLNTYLEDFNFKEKKKYLKKQKVKCLSDAYTTLVKYTNKLLDDVDQYIKEEDRLNCVRWFFFYLLNGKNKVDIFMIHSILGYKYKGAVKLYSKLFLKDHSTGRNEDFLLHTDILNLQEYHLQDENNLIYETILDHI